MTCARLLAALLLVSSAANAQSVASTGPENTPDRCMDGIDNDANGFADCSDPKCLGFYICGRGALTSRGDEKLSPKAMMAAGSIMMVAGAGIGASSSSVFLEALANPIQSKAIMEYAVGGVMVAASVALIIGGAVVLRKGIVRHREDVALGLAFSPTRMALRVTF